MPIQYFIGILIRFTYFCFYHSNQNFISMKNLKNFAGLLIVLFIISSCSKKPAEMIVGEWKIVDIATSDEIPEEIMEQHKQSLEEMKASSLFVIKADSTFDNTISETTNSGKWKLSEDGKKLTLIYEAGNEEVSNIDELSETKLVTSIDVNGAKNTISFEKQGSK